MSIEVSIEINKQREPTKYKMKVKILQKALFIQNDPLAIFLCTKLSMRPAEQFEFDCFKASYAFFIT